MLQDFVILGESFAKVKNERINKCQFGWEWIFLNNTKKDELIISVSVILNVGFDLWDEVFAVARVILGWLPVKLEKIPFITCSVP